ncbi:hypothetical protein [Oleidesulfovibrio sp.]|uniref:hypothetical protein n=1 Tax=Oleidesulfovibrio sp. TaxID=2909707 RepID=UPI003A8BC37B
MEIKMAISICAAAVAAFIIRKKGGQSCIPCAVLYGAVGIGIVTWFILNAILD